MATTSPDNIYYPVSTDQVAPLATHFQTLATSTQTALNTKGSVGITKVLVKNGSGASLSAGTAVYVTGSDGTDILVAAASYTDTKRRVLGLLQSTVAANATAYVVTQGTVSAINTNAASAAGVSVWLGLNGALVYGTKPSSPYYTAYIGVVRKKGISDGSIEINIQNGFKVNELQNITSSIQDGETITYYAGDGQYYGGPVYNKNYLINAAFDFWQRGTSSSGVGYIADRWYNQVTNGSIAVTRSTDVPTYTGKFAKPTYSMQIASTNAYNPGITQRIESVNSRNLVGLDVLLSAWLKTSAVTGENFSYSISTPTVADDWTNSTVITSGVLSGDMGTTWTRAYTSFNVPASAVRGLSITIYRDHTNASTTSLYTAIQLEAGAYVPTQFSRAGNSYGAELALCQRYYYKNFPAVVTTPYGVGYAKTTTVGTVFIPYPVEMRTAPTAVETNGVATGYRFTNAAGLSQVGAAVPTLISSTSYGSQLEFTVNTTNGGLTVGQGGMALTQSGTSYLAFSAEL